MKKFLPFLSICLLMSNLFGQIDSTYTIIGKDTIYMNPLMKELMGVTVAASKPIYMNDGEKILYNVSEDASIQTGTIADALQNAPGVEVDIEGNITLRGVSSVEIWMNGRPSKINVENLKTYIQQMPANSLERIEVITNPSARYTAQGAGGIINLVTKSNITKNSFLSFGINGSTKPMASPWLSYMYSNEKFSFNVYSYAYFYQWRTHSNGYNIILNNEMDTSSYRSYTDTTKNDYLYLGFNFNLSYNFDSLKTLSVYGGFWGDIFDTRYTFKDYKYQEFINNPGIYDYTEKTQTENPWMGGWYGIEYEHNFNDDGHTLTAELSGYFNRHNRNDIYNRQFTYYPNLNRNFKTSSIGTNFEFEVNLDYTYPYHEDGELSIGVNSDFDFKNYCRRTDTLFDISSDRYLLDSMRFEDHQSYIHQIDLYATVQHSFGNFTMKGGLRFQNRIYKYNTLNMPDMEGSGYFPGLFPSLHLSYKTNKMHNFNLSYTRRISYPWTGQINPFIIYNEDSYFMGNKNLQPTYTNAIEAGWTKYFEKFGSVGISAYFRNNKDEINSLTDVIYNDYFGRYVYYDTYVNSGKSHRYGANLNVTWKLKTFMNIRLDANISQSHSETVFREDEPIVKTDNFHYYFRINFWAKLWKFLEVNASGYYSAKQKMLFFETEPYYGINCGLRADFWQKKISVFLNVQDIFNWGKNTRANTNPYYIAYSSTKYNSRFISAGITFRFGKMELESRAQTGGKTE